MDERELYHWGIKGMKWGVRRYQNKDGSLTPEGRSRYSDGDGVIKSAAKKVGQKISAHHAAKKESKRIEKLMKKPISKLSADELKERTERTKKEKELRDIERQSNELANKAQSFIKRFGSQMLSEAVVPATIAAGKQALTKFLGEKFEDALGVGAVNTYNILKKSGFDYNKLTDAQAEALKKREGNINTAKQQKEQRDRVGSGDNNPDNNSGGKKNKDKNKDKSKQENNQESKSKPKASNDSGDKKNVSTDNDFVTRRSIKNRSYKTAGASIVRSYRNTSYKSLNSHDDIPAYLKKKSKDYVGKHAAPEEYKRKRRAGN